MTQRNIRRFCSRVKTIMVQHRPTPNLLFSLHRLQVLFRSRTSTEFLTGGADERKEQKKKLKFGLEGRLVTYNQKGYINVNYGQRSHQSSLGFYSDQKSNEDVCFGKCPANIVSIFYNITKNLENRKKRDFAEFRQLFTNNKVCTQENTQLDKISWNIWNGA